MKARFKVWLKGYLRQKFIWHALFLLPIWIGIGIAIGHHHSPLIRRVVAFLAIATIVILIVWARRRPAR